MPERPWSQQPTGVRWSYSLFLHWSHKLDVLKDLLAKASWLDVSQVEFGFVDSYASEKSLLEAEATAVIGSQA